MYRMIRNSFVIINPAVLHQEAVGFVNSGLWIKSPGPSGREISRRQWRGKFHSSGWGGGGGEEMRTPLPSRI